MKPFKDLQGRSIRLTQQRLEHLESDHPEMLDQIDRIEQALQKPDTIIRSKTDSHVELFYRLYKSTPVTEKYLCVVIKSSTENPFIVTAYFTDAIKAGEILWQKK
jgi:hypothetical protein